ncbi:MAG: transcription-repair coupling factor (superfamily II helicase), partial [Planctomycetota bacterium]
MSDASTETAVREISAGVDPQVLETSAPFLRLVQDLGRRRRVEAGSLWGASQSMVLAALAQRLPGPFLILASTNAEAEVALDELATFGAEASLFPAREATSTGAAHADPESVRLRLRMTQALAGPEEKRPKIIVTSLLALLQPIPSAADMERDFLHLHVGQRFGSEQLMERLVNAGYTRQPLAEKPGEVSLRGDI